MKAVATALSIIMSLIAIAACLVCARACWIGNWDHAAGAGVICIAFLWFGRGVAKTAFEV